MSDEMDDDQFAQMLKLSTVYIPILKSRCLFDDLREMDSSEEHNALNCLEIVADTFLEMQRRIGVKPKLESKPVPQYRETSMSDNKPPCECIESVNGRWTYRCECSNGGDAEGAAYWVAYENARIETEIFRGKK